MKKFTIIALICAGSVVEAAPIDLMSFTSAEADTRQFAPFVDRLDNGEANEGTGDVQASASRRFGSAQASVEFDSGRLRTEARAQVDGFSGSSIASATARLTEIFQFSEDSTISYSFFLDGFFDLGQPNDLVFTDAFVRVFDVTDVDRIFNPSLVLGQEVRDLTFETVQNTVHTSSGRVQFRGSAATDGATVAEPNFRLVDNAEGTSTFEVFEVSGTFDVQRDRLYALNIIQSSFARNAGLSSFTNADFGSTGIFSFTDLGGAEFRTASGTFLQSAGTIGAPDELAPIPLPAGLPLLLAGIFSLGVAAKRKKTNM